MISRLSVASVTIVLALAGAVSAVDSKNETGLFNITVAAPAKCKASECKLSLTVSHMNDGFKFSLHAEDKSYVAVAFARSAMMGNDSVIVCVATSESKAIKVYHSTNSGPPLAGRDNIRDREQNINSIATNITGGSKDGHVFCSFVLKPTTTFPSSSLDLMKSRYYLQIVSGENMRSSNNIGKHNKWATTLRGVSLTKDEGELRTVDSLQESCPSAGNKLTTTVWMLFTVMFIAKAWQQL